MRIRSVRFLPGFAVHALRTQRQARKAAGLQAGAILADRARTFWTMTVWDNEGAMRQYMLAGAHRQAMPKLFHWCDEASVVHWTQPYAGSPSWAEADQRMRADGRPSKVRHPSSHHATLDYHPPRLTRSGPINPTEA